MSSTPRPVQGSSSSASSSATNHPSPSNSAAVVAAIPLSSSRVQQQQHASGSGSSSSSITSSSRRTQPVVHAQPPSSRHQPLHYHQQSPLAINQPSASAPFAQAAGVIPFASASDTPHTTHISTSLSQSLSTPAVLAHMARMQSHFAQLAPSCAAHLADQNAVPILSTTVPSSPALASLSAAFVHAHDTACRMGLGLPLRVTLNTGGGAAVIQTGTYPEHSASVVGGGDSEAEDMEDDMMRGMLAGGVGGKEGMEKMMLVGTVVAPRERLADARIASWGVEDMARKLQRCLSEGK